MSIDEWRWVGGGWDEFSGSLALGVVGGSFWLMSRRARRRKEAGKSSRLPKLLGVLVLLVMLVLAGGYLWMRSYLHSEAFRKFLAAELGDAANVEAVFGPFRWDGLAVETEGVDAEGDGMVSLIRAERIATEVGFGGVSRGVWEVKATRIHKLEVGLDLTARERVAEKEPGEVGAGAGAGGEKADAKGWVPREVELEALEVSELSLMAKTAAGAVAASGMRVFLEPAGGKGSYKVSVSGGRVKTPMEWLPPLVIEKLDGRYGDGDVFITEVEVSAWDEGRITGAGEWGAESGLYSFEGRAGGLKCDEILDESWARKLQGDLEVDFSVNNFSGDFSASGDLSLRNGVLTAMPVLDILAAYADTRRFRTIQLSEAHTGWRFSGGVISLTDLVVASDGLLRLEGDVTVRGEAIDGRLRLGIVPGLLVNLPGAETDVFTPGERGMLWAPVHLTGTLDDPKEDLSERLIIAAGFRILEGLPEGADKVLEVTKGVLGENPEEVIDKGKKIFEEGEKVIDDASGILRGLLGN